MGRDGLRALFLLSSIFIEQGCPQKTNPKVLEKMQKSITQLETSIESTFKQIQPLAAQSAAISNQVTTIQRSIDTISMDVDTNSENIKKLDEINQLWKSNFRVISNTFQNIRRQVTFSRPNIRTLSLPALIKRIRQSRLRGTQKQT